MKRYLIVVASLIFAFPLVGQFHYVGKGGLKIGLKVTKEGRTFPIDSLCDGFDPMTSVPLNLVIPEGSSMGFDVDSISSSNTIVSIKTNTSTNDFMLGDELGTKGGFSTSSSPGSEKIYEFIDPDNQDTLTIKWSVAYDKVRLQDLFPAEYFPKYVSLSWSFLFSSYPDTSQYEWSQYDFIDQIDSVGLPVNPAFPYNFNGLFFLPSNIDNNAKVKLVGLHDDWLDFDDSEPFEYFLWKDLAPGDYVYMIKPTEDASKELWLEYPFTILKPWWLQTPFLIGEAVFLTLLVAGFAFAIYRNRARKKERRLLLQQQLTEAELKAIRAQLNPHFLFNALSSIQNLVARKQGDQAQTYLNKLSKLLREVLSVSERQFHELEAELRLTSLYLELEQLRYPFAFKIHKAQGDEDQTLVPVMLLQPFVENAVKHAMAGQENGKIDIFIEQAGHQLMISIEDDGPGLPENTRDSDGLRLSKERIKYLQSIYKDEVALSIKNKEGAGGAIVTITLPVE
jgi:hypothetical protein